MPIFQAPPLDLEDTEVIDEIHAYRHDLRSSLRAPRRWTGGLRRTTQARAIQGSNTIEGYTVSDQDALAAVEDEAPLTADQRTWAEILGYRRVLTYVINVAAEPGFRIDLPALNAMHFMLLEHELSKLPGRYRTSSIYVHDDRTGRTVYEGPDPEQVADLMGELVADLYRSAHLDPLVRGAMAHLNLVMIHPYRDGNGRMARALQTMVLAQDSMLEPTFASIEEWLGNNTEDYYAVLAATGRGQWQPDLDAGLWVKFNLRGHHFQAQTLRRRIAEAERLYVALDDLIARHRLPERVADPLFDAALGGRVTRPSYLKRVEQLETRSATRDLQRLADLGLLLAHGQTRARYYTAGGELAEVRDRLRRERSPLHDPYLHLTEEIQRAAARHARRSLLDRP